MAEIVSIEEHPRFVVRCPVCGRPFIRAGYGWPRYCSYRCGTVAQPERTAVGSWTGDQKKEE